MNLAVILASTALPFWGVVTSILGLGVGIAAYYQARAAKDAALGAEAHIHSWDISQDISKLHSDLTVLAGLWSQPNKRKPHMEAARRTLARLRSLYNNYLPSGARPVLEEVLQWLKEEEATTKPTSVYDILDSLIELQGAIRGRRAVRATSPRIKEAASGPE